MTLVLELPQLPPKEYSHNSGDAHWSKKAKVHQKIASDVYMLLLEAGWKPTQQWERAKLTITFYLPDRRRYDHDNLVGAMKPVIDALGPQRFRDRHGKVVTVQERLLKDDSVWNIGLPEYRFEVRKGQPGTLIEIQEAG